MQSILKGTLLILFALTGNFSEAQLVRNTGNMAVNSGVTLFIAGSFENASGGTPTNSGTLQLTGDFTNNGNDFTASGTGTTSFSGTSTQNINGTTSTSFYNLSKPNGNIVVLGNNATIKNLFSLTDGKFQLNDKTLTLNGNITGAGFVTGSAKSGLVIGTPSGTNLGTLLFDQTTDTVTNALKTLNITNGGIATLGNTLNMAPGNPTDGYGTVTVTGAAGNLDANAFLILRSNSLGDARVAQSTGKITDTVMVERYIPKRRAWRFINVPFGSSNQSINTAWMEGATPNPSVYVRNNPKPGYGVEITYWHNSQLSGFDENTTSNPSIRTWDASIQTWGAGVTNTLTTKITDWDAYYLFIRGDRSVDLSLATAAPSTATTLRARGILNETASDITKTYNGIVASQRFFAGNPFASAINILPVLTRSANVAPNKFWVWDPNNVTGQYPYNVGYYVTYSNGVFTPNDGKYKGGTNLQIGQAFMAESTGGSPQLTFRQQDKINTQAIVFGIQAMGKPTPGAPSVIYTNLLSAGMNGGSVDGVATGFGKRYSSDIDTYDAVKLWNQNESMALIRDNQPLAIEFRPVPELTDTLFYRMYLYVQPYTLQIFSANLPADLPAEAWLIDKYLNTETPVDLYDTTLYDFTPSADTNTYLNRFMLVFNRVPKNKPPGNTNNGNYVPYAHSESGIKLYPNPVTDYETTMQFNNMPKASYEVVVYNNKGEKLATRTVAHKGGKFDYPLPVSATWTSGLYNITIINKDSQKTISLQLVINR